MYDLICELEVTTATRDGELGVVVTALRSMKGHTDAGQDRAILQRLGLVRCWTRGPKRLMGVQGLRRTFGGERARVAGLGNAESICVPSVIFAVLPDSECPISEEIRNKRDGFPNRASSDARFPSAECLYDQE